MKVSALQRIDRWIGVPLCFLLTLVRELFGRSKVSGVQSVRRLLFVKLAEQGSTVLAHSALRRAVQLVGPENVFCVVFDANRFILDALGLIPKENVIPIRFGNISELAGSSCQALLKMRRLEVDAAIDLEFFARGSAAITFLSGAKTRVGFHAFFGAGPYRGDLMTHRLLYNPYLHTSQIFQQMVEALLEDPTALPTCGILPPKVNEDLPRFAAETGEVDAIRTLIARETGRELPPAHPAQCQCQRPAAIDVSAAK